MRYFCALILITNRLINEQNHEEDFLLNAGYVYLGLVVINREVEEA